MAEKTDCSFIEGKDRFRYRVGGIVVCGSYALFGVNEKCDYYYTVGGGVHMGEKSEDAILRELYEETGERMSIIRPLCLVENFFDGDGIFEGFDCHVLELYYLIECDERKDFNAHSVTAGDAEEKACWLPFDRIEEYDIRPPLVKELLKEMPTDFRLLVNDVIKRKD